MSLKKQFKGFAWWTLFCVALVAIAYWHFGQRQLMLRYSAFSLKNPVTFTINDGIPFLSVAETLQEDREEGFSFIGFPQTPGPIAVTIHSSTHGSQSCRVEIASRGCTLEVFLTATELICDRSCDRSF